MDMVAVEGEQVLGLILTKTLETSVGLVEVVAVVLASLQVMAVLKTLVVMEVQVMEDQEIKLEKVKQVPMHHLMLVVMVVMVVITVKVEEKLVMVETEEIKLMLHKVEPLEVPTEVLVDHQVLMGMV